MAVGVLRVRDGLDYMDVMREQRVCDAQRYSNSPELRPEPPMAPVVPPASEKAVSGLKPRKSKRKPFSIYTMGTETIKALAATVENFDLSLLNTSQSQREVLASVNQFQTKVKKGTVDVWWLADDGGTPRVVMESPRIGIWCFSGLTLLIPYILTHHRSYLNGAKLRVFTGPSGKQSIQDEHRR